MDFKNNLLFFPCEVCNPVDREKWGFHLNFFGGEKILDLELNEEMVLAFAVKAAAGGCLEMIEMGNPIFAPPHF